MKKVLFWMLSLIFVLFVSGCTENQYARTFGGTMKVKVKSGYKVTSATWKEDDLFYFIEPMEKDYQPKKKYFIEDSNFGMVESEVVFIESY